MSLSVGGYPRIPFHSVADAAARAALTDKIEGDLIYQEDTKVLYSYDGATDNAVGTGAWESLYTDILTSDGTLDTGAAGVASGYKHLKIIINCKAKTTNNSWVGIQFNNDSGNNYSYKYGQDTGAAYSSGSAAAQPLAGVGICSTASLNTIIVIDVVNVTANNKVLTFSCSSPGYVVWGGAIYSGAAAEISRVKLLNNSDTDLASGSSMLILGCAGS